MPLAPRVRRLDKNHDVQFGGGQDNYASGSESTAQRVRTALLEIQGECFLDTTAGVPWYKPEDDPDFADVVPIMGGAGAPDLAYAEAVLKARILSVDGVASIESFSIVLDHVSRSLSVSVTATDIDGAVFTVAIQDPGP